VTETLLKDFLLQRGEALDFPHPRSEKTNRSGSFSQPSQDRLLSSMRKPRDFSHPTRDWHSPSFLQKQRWLKPLDDIPGARDNLRTILDGGLEMRPG
jgi:hypothetical protein